MTSRDFCYWLQGWLEIEDPKAITPAQLKTIKKHLSMVFLHEIDPSFGGKKEQDALDKLHREGVTRRGGEMVMKC